MKGYPEMNGLLDFKYSNDNKNIQKLLNPENSLEQELNILENIYNVTINQLSVDINSLKNKIDHNKEPNSVSILESKID